MVTVMNPNLAMIPTMNPRPICCGKVPGGINACPTCLAEKIYLTPSNGLIQTIYGPRLKEVLEYGYQLGLDKYPIFDEGFRPILNLSIVNHYFMREIGAETVELFIFYLNRRMWEHMPTWNPIFQRVSDPNYDPFINTDLATDRNINVNGTNNATTKNATHDVTNTDGTVNDVMHESTHADVKGTAVNSNAPQVMISQGGDAPDKYWNTGARQESTTDSTADRTDDVKTHQTRVSDGTDNTTFFGTTGNLTAYVQKLKGNQGVLNVDALQRWIDVYMNPLLGILNNIEPCFSQLYTDHFNGL
jgi:hypothetical protein